MNMQNHYLNSSIITIIAVLFVLFIAAGCSVLLQKQVDLQESQSGKSNLADVSTWQTYRNEKYGFEVKYPLDFVLSDIEVNALPDISIKDKITGVKIMHVVPGCQSEVKDITIEFFPISQSLKEVKKSVGTFRSLREFLIGNVHGYYYVLGVAETPPIYAYLTALSPNQSLYILWEPLLGCNAISFKEQEELFGHILTTLKLVSQNSTLDASTWQTYRNEQYGFEFKYPSEWLILSGDEDTIVRIAEFDMQQAETDMPIDMIDISQYNPIINGTEAIFAGKKATIGEWEEMQHASGFIKFISVIEQPTLSIFLEASAIDSKELLNITLSTFKFIEPTFTQSQNICDSIIGSSFQSVDQQEIGLGPPNLPLPMGYWNIDFMADGSFSWHHSDMVEKGYYTCQSGILSAKRYNDLAVRISFDTSHQILIWNGVDYKMQKK